MWNLTKEAQAKFLHSHLLPIPKNEQEWEYEFANAKEEGIDLNKQLKEQLENVKDALLKVLPSRFVPYIENRTLNQPTLSKEITEDYLQWIREGEKEFGTVLNAAYENTKKTIPFLPENVQEIFNESLHDSQIVRIEREGHQLHLYLNTEGGFTPKAMVQLIFKDIDLEKSDEPLQTGQWYIYNELIKTENGIAFRVLFDCPNTEWTIEMKDIDAKYYYRPVNYVMLKDEGRIAEKDFYEYISELNKEHDYMLITPNVEIPIKDFTQNSPYILLDEGSLEFKENKLLVLINHEKFEYDLTEQSVIQFIYTNVYENPYARFSEPIPEEELEEAVFSNDLELQVRAWNTMHANPENLKDTINRILLKINIADENETTLWVFINHFYKHNILTEQVIEKFKEIIEK